MYKTFVTYTDLYSSTLCEKILKLALIDKLAMGMLYGLALAKVYYPWGMQIKHKINRF